MWQCYSMQCAPRVRPAACRVLSRKPLASATGQALSPAGSWLRPVCGITSLASRGSCQEPCYQKMRLCLLGQPGRCPVFCSLSLLRSFPGCLQPPGCWTTGPRAGGSGYPALHLPSAKMQSLLFSRNSVCLRVCFSWQRRSAI